MNCKANKIIATLLICITAIAFFGCSSRLLVFEKLADHTNIVENSVYGKIDMKFDTLDGEDVRVFTAKPGASYDFKYEYNIAKGDIKIIFTDSKENILAQTKWKSEVETEIRESEGDTAILNGSGGVEAVKSADERLRIVIIGKEASGNLKIVW